MNDLENELRQVAFSEPPLGFDPDDLATKAAKRQRNRRATIGAAGVSLVLAAGVVVVTAVTPHAPAPVATQPPPTYLPPVIVVKPPQQAQTALEKRNMEHLKEVLPGLLPNARKIVIDGFFSFGGELHADEMTVAVAFVDHEGKGYSFNLGIEGPIVVANNLLRLAEVCPGTAESATCRRQPDGSTVMIKERSAIHYRTDSTALDMSDMGRVAPMYTDDLGLPRPTGMEEGPRAMNDQQVIALLTDPGFRAQ